MGKVYCSPALGGGERMSKEVCSLFTKKNQHKGFVFRQVSHTQHSSSV